MGVNFTFLCVYLQAKIAEHLGLKEAEDIPSGWRSVSKIDALKNLRLMYAINTEDDGEGTFKKVVRFVGKRANSFCTKTLNFHRLFSL